VETKKIPQSETVSLHEYAHLQPGQTLRERYQILRIIGTGGMGAVYEARDLNFPDVVRLCAVKEISFTSNQRVTQTQQLRTFEQEVNLLASLSHPAIPKIYDRFHGDTHSYLVLELIRGQNLETYSKQSAGPLPENTVVRWAIGICDVLHYLHSREPEPIVFRDMKPSNVMLNEHGQIVLVDFGIAKVFRGEQRGTMIGTEGYSPPEQYRGIATPRGDIYALGATMHHLLTGLDPTQEAPFSFDDRPVGRHNPTVSPEIESIVSRALAYEPEERFSSAIEMRMALESALTGAAVGHVGSPVRKSKEWTVEPLWSFQCEDEIRSSPMVSGGVVYTGCYDHNLYAIDMQKGEFRWKFATEGGIAATPAEWKDFILIGSEDFCMYGISYTGRVRWKCQTKGKVRSSPRIAYEHVFFGSDDTHIYGVQASSGRVVWKSPAGGPVRSTPVVGNEMLYVGCEDGYLYALNLRQGALQWRHHCGGGVTSSPLLWKGLLLVGSTDRHLYALDVNSGWPVWRFRTEKAVISSPRVHEETVYVGSADNGLYALEATAGRLRWRFETEGQVNSSPAIGPDAVFVGSADGSVYAIDMQSGKKRWKFETEGPVVSSPILHENVVYVGSLDGRLYALPA
jgi:eukaryotic-like serine/threonine-protein kinase